MTKLLDSLIDKGERHARRILLKEKHPEMVALYHLVIPNEQDMLFPLMFQNDYEKNACIAIVAATAKVMGAIACMLISEAWMMDVRTTKATKNMTLEQAERYAEEHLPRPSESPDRIEVVQIIATDGTVTKARSLRMLRDKKGKLIGLAKCKESDNEQLSGRMIDGIIQKRTIN